MTGDQPGSGPPPATRPELEAEIAELRSDLGATVEALSHKLDVKGRVKERIGSVSPAVPVAAGLMVVAVVAVVVWRRRS